MEEKFDADAWALGIMLYELMALKKPFDAPNAHMLYQVVTRGVRASRSTRIGTRPSSAASSTSSSTRSPSDGRPGATRGEAAARSPQPALQASRNAHLHACAAAGRVRAPSAAAFVAIAPTAAPATADTASAARVEAVDEALTLRVPTDGRAALWRQPFSRRRIICNATLAALRAKLEPLGASGEAAALRGQLVAGKEAASAEEQRQAAVAEEARRLEADVSRARARRRRDRARRAAARDRGVGKRR